MSQWLEALAYIHDASTIRRIGLNVSDGDEREDRKEVMRIGKGRLCDERISPSFYVYVLYTRRAVI